MITDNNMAAVCHKSICHLSWGIYLGTGKEKKGYDSLWKDHKSFPYTTKRTVKQNRRQPVARCLFH